MQPRDVDSWQARQGERGGQRGSGYSQMGDASGPNWDRDAGQRFQPSGYQDDYGPQGGRGDDARMSGYQRGSGQIDDPGRYDRERVFEQGGEYRQRFGYDEQPGYGQQSSYERSSDFGHRFNDRVQSRYRQRGAVRSEGLLSGRGTVAEFEARGWGPRDWDGEPYQQRQETGRFADAHQGPHAGRGPKGYQRSDDRIREEVCEALTHHGGVDAREIDVNVRNGEVTLTGSVTERAQKRAAEDAIEGVSGVSDVHNQIRVQAQSAQPTPSTPTTSRGTEPHGMTDRPAVNDRAPARAR